MLTDSAQAVPWWTPFLDMIEGLVVLVVQTTALSHFLSWTFCPDFIFLFLAYKTITRPLSSVLVTAFVIGLCQDSLTAPHYFGLNMAAKITTVAVMSLLQESVWHQRKAVFFLLIILVGAGLHHVLFGLMAWMSGMQNLPGLFLTAGFSAFSTVLTGYLIIGLWYYWKGDLYGQYSR
jgi:rod shape-determining protein MreD